MRQQQIAAVCVVASFVSCFSVIASCFCCLSLTAACITYVTGCDGEPTSTGHTRTITFFVPSSSFFCCFLIPHSSHRGTLTTPTSLYSSPSSSSPPPPLTSLASTLYSAFPSTGVHVTTGAPLSSPATETPSTHGRLGALVTRVSLHPDHSVLLLLLLLVFLA